MPAVLLGSTIGVLVVAATIWALVDLSQHEVVHLPRWGWAVVVVLLSVVGVVAYLLAGRVPADGRPPLLDRLLRGDGDRADASFMLYGLVIGMLIGTAIGQLAMGLALGLVVGALVDAYRSHRSGR